VTALADAMVYAASVHRNDLRKGSGLPYVTHLIDVCARVGTMHGTPDARVAALLHDVVEDHGIAHLRPIAEQFGASVARIVERCSDSTELPKPPWRGRKVAYIERVHAHLDDLDYVCVTLADKLSNVHAIASDHAAIGDALYDLFANAGATTDERRRNTLSYYADLARAFAGADLPSPMAAGAAELGEVVAALGATDAHTLRGP
jgi:HD domain